jgi:pyrophosphatase PpaX
LDYHPSPLSRPDPIAILFDLDGTLVDTLPFILAAVRHAFDGYGSCPTEAEWTAGTGTPLRAQMASYVRRPEDVDALVQRYRTFWIEEHDRRTHAFPGVVETVAELARRGHPLGVVTAKTEHGAFRTLRHTGLLPFMRAVIGADTCARAKPDPEPVRVALARLGRAAGEAVLVGDATHDVAAARAAGVRAIGVAWGAASREALARAGADAILEGFHDLPALVAGTADARSVG